jgi:hypothetical protein
MRTHSRDGRNRLPLILGIGVLVLVAAGILAFALGRNSVVNAPIARPSESSSSLHPTPTKTEISAGSDDDTGPAPTGCLGGNPRDVNMLLDAQKSAPHTAFGAVEIAAAFARWSYQFPYPPAADSSEVSAAVIASNATSANKDLAGGYLRAGDITNGNVPANTPFFFSTTNGLWDISSESSSDDITVTVNGSYVINGVLSPTKTAASAFELVWQGGSWRILTAVQPDVQRLAAGGTTFTGGC